MLKNKQQKELLENYLTNLCVINHMSENLSNPWFALPKFDHVKILKAEPKVLDDIPPTLIRLTVSFRPLHPAKKQSCCSYLNIDLLKEQEFRSQLLFRNKVKFEKLRKKGFKEVKFYEVN